MIKSGWKTWDKHLSQFAGKQIGVIEIGIYLGDSTLWFLDNLLTHPKSQIYSMDTFQGSPEYGIDFDMVKSKFYQRVENHPRVKQLTVLEDTSFNGLVHLNNKFKNKQMCDVIYIDGSHVASDVMMDIIGAWNLMKYGGIIIFDDYIWGKIGEDVFAPKMAIDAFINIFKPYIEIIHKKRQVFIRKKKTTEKIFRTPDIYKIESIQQFKLEIMYQNPLELVIESEKTKKFNKNIKYSESRHQDVFPYIEELDSNSLKIKNINSQTDCVSVNHVNHKDYLNNIKYYLNKVWIDDNVKRKLMEHKLNIDKFVFYSIFTHDYAPKSNQNNINIFHNSAELGFRGNLSIEKYLLYSADILLNYISRHYNKKVQVYYTSNNKRVFEIKKPNIKINFLNHHDYCSIKNINQMLKGYPKMDIIYLNIFKDCKHLDDNFLYQIYFGLKLLDNGGNLIIDSYKVTDDAQCQTLELLFDLFGKIKFQAFPEVLDGTSLLILSNYKPKIERLNFITEILTDLENSKSRFISSIGQKCNIRLTNNLKKYYERYIDGNNGKFSSSELPCS